MSYFISSWHDLYFHKVTWFVKSAQVQIRQIRAQKREQSSIVLKKASRNLVLDSPCQISGFIENKKKYERIFKFIP